MCVFQEELKKTLRDREVLPDNWTTTAKVIRETLRKVFDLLSGMKEVDKEIW